MTELPESVGELRFFTAVSSGVGTITSAIQLYLSFNSISALPPSLFVSLTNLTVLSIRHNMITSLPPAVSNLVHLQELSLGGNRFSFLPAEILTLGRLTLLNVSNNPFLTDPRTFLDSQHALALSKLLPGPLHHAYSQNAISSKVTGGSPPHYHSNRSSSRGASRSRSASLGTEQPPSSNAVEERVPDFVLRYHRAYSNHQHFSDLRRPRAQRIPSLLELCLRQIAREKTANRAHPATHGHGSDLLLPASIKYLLAVPPRQCFSCQTPVVTWYIRDIQIKETLSVTVPLEFAFCSPACFFIFASQQAAFPPPDAQQPADHPNPNGTAVAPPQPPPPE